MLVGYKGNYLSSINIISNILGNLIAANYKGKP